MALSPGILKGIEDTKRELDELQINGKKLGDCTGAECRHMGAFFTYCGSHYVTADRTAWDLWEESRRQATPKKHRSTTLAA